jgi:replicative DNA helicase
MALDGERVLADRASEQALIAAALVDNRAIFRVDVSPDDFSDPFHAEIWRIACDLIEGGRKFSVGVIAPQFEERSTAYLASLAASGLVVTDLKHHAASVKDFAGRRRLQDVLRDGLEAILETEAPAEEIAAGLAGEIRQTAVSGKLITKREAATEAYEALRKPRHAFSTGIRALDGAMGGGLYAGKCYGIGARHKVGKTTLLGTISHNLNKAGVRHLYTAGEMTPIEIEQRNIAREAGFNSVQFLTRTRADLDTLVGEYAATIPNNTTYERAANKTKFDIQRMIANAVMRGERGVIVDYLQLIGGRERNQSQAEHYDVTAQMLADMATEHDIFILVASQLNQTGNVRGGEGLKNAADWYGALHRCGPEGAESSTEAWLEVECTRYTPYARIGNQDAPGLWLHLDRGPFFSDEMPDHTKAA